jgi:tetratricopeptide (TPR) repeat protein
MQASEKGLKGNIIHRDDLENLIAGYLRLRDVSNPFKIAGKIIEQLRKRDFILCHLGKDYYGFVHRTFLEYFCATAIKERFNKRGKPEGLSIEQLKDDIFGQHWQDKSWHEVLRLISGTIDAEFVAEVMEYLIDVYEETSNISPLILAAECFNEVDSRVKLENASERLLKALQGALETDGDKYIIAKTIALYWQDNPAVMDWLEEYGLNHQPHYWMREIAQGIAAITLPDVDKNWITDIADIYFWQNQCEKAIFAYLRGFNLTFASQYALGRAYINLKRFDEAIAHCQQWLNKEPQNQWGYFLLGYTYIQTGRYEEAVEAFNDAIEIAGKDNIDAIAHLRGLGWTYQDWGKYDEAIEILNRAVNIDPENKFNSDTYEYLGLNYDDLGQYDEAIAAYYQAIKLYSQNFKAYNDLGCLYRIREQWEDATDAFYNAIELNPRYSGAYRNLGIVYLLKGDFTQAKQAFTTAIKSDSRYGGAILSLGILQALQGDIKQAQTTWQEGLEIYPEYAQEDRLFRTLYTIAMGETQLGLNTLQQILRQEKPPVGLLRYVLETAHLLQRCLPPIAGINEAVEMIEGISAP